MRKLAHLALALITASCTRTPAAVAPGPALPSQAAAISPAPLYQPADSVCRPMVRPGTTLQPLMVVDGRLLTCAERNAMSAMSPNEIVRVDVVKGHKTPSLYGAHIPGGLIVVTTKRKP